MKKAILRIISFLVMAVLVLSFSAGSMAAERAATVHNPNAEDRLNLRTQPNEEAPTLGKYYNGVNVEMLGDVVDGWVKVRFYNLEGYMRADFLEYGSNAAPVASAMPSVTVKNSGGTGLNLRTTQSIDSPSLGLYKNGASVLVYGVDATWCHVQTSDGKVGFMLREQLSPLIAFDKGTGSGSSGGNTGGGGTGNSGGNTGSGGSGAVQGTWLNVNNAVLTDRLHLRTAPRTDANSLGKYYNGVSVEVLSYPSNDWAEVRIGNTVGYMQRKFLTSGSVISAIPLATVSNPNAADQLNLRAGMSETDASLGKYSNGTKVEVLGVGTTWHHVRVDGKMGYMMAKYLTPIGGTGSGSGSDASRIPGVTRNVVISYDPAATHPFSQADLDAAAASVIAYFQTNYTGCEMVRLWYDEARSDEILLSFPETQISPNFIVFLCEFNVVTGSSEKGLEPGMTYDEWQMIAKRKDSQSPWVAGTLGL